MKFEALVFDIYGTLIDIETDESSIRTYEEISQFLRKYDFRITPLKLKGAYFSIQNKWINEKRETYGFKYPEVRVVDVWREILVSQTKCPVRCSAETIDDLSETLPLLFRQLTLRKIGILPSVIPTLEKLNQKGYTLSIISNAQSMLAIPELNEFRLMKYFHPIIISSDFGVKKPEKILFKEYLRKMKLKPDQIVFVGNDMRDDVYGAQSVGIKTIFVDTPIGRDDYKDVEPDICIKRMDELLEYL